MKRQSEDNNESARIMTAQTIRLRSRITTDLTAFGETDKIHPVDKDIIRSSVAHGSNRHDGAWAGESFMVSGPFNPELDRSRLNR
jgi:hypothetical protein